MAFGLRKIFRGASRTPKELELALEFGVKMRPNRDGTNHFEENLVSRADDLMRKKKKIHRRFPINIKWLAGDWGLFGFSG